MKKKKVVEIIMLLVFLFIFKTEKIQNISFPSIKSGYSRSERESNFNTVPQRRGSQPSYVGDDVLFMVRRQLALKELELSKVKSQLSNLANEAWKKNLQVAELKVYCFWCHVVVVTIFVVENKR